MKTWRTIPCLYYALNSLPTLCPTELSLGLEYHFFVNDSSCPQFVISPKLSFYL